MSEQIENFDEFVEEVADKIGDYLLPLKVEKIITRSVKKNNGIDFTGMAVVEKGEEVTPNIYLEYYYKSYKNGSEMSEILKSMADEYRKAKERIASSKICIPKKDEVKERAFLRLVNYERNREQLEEEPYIPFMDMAVTFRYLSSIDEEGISSIAIKNDDLDRWNINVKELYVWAQKNTKRLFPPVLEKLSDRLKRMSICPEEADIELYILTNGCGINGAVNMVFKELLDSFAKELGTGIYILPSSIHEVLLLPDSGNVQREELRQIVAEVNRVSVIVTEYLSDSVYYYDLDTGTILI